VLGATIDEIMPPERAANTRAIWSRALRGESFTIDIEREVTGKLMRFETRFHPIRDAEGGIIGASQNSRDVTAIHRVADEIRKANEELLRAKEQLETEAAERRKLEARIAETIEAERQSLRNELHDGLCQELAGIGFMTSVLSRNLAATSHPESGNARSISDLVNSTLARTRMLARGASPVEAGRDGLMFALKELSASTGRAYGITCLFEGGSSVPVASNAAAGHLYRIAQEAMHNAVEHGKAKLIRISLTPHGEGGRLSIVNDGTGFVEPAQGHSGMGVRLMRHRAAAIGATLIIGPLSEGGGTAVVCEWKEGL
jgi:signal transduction histidine kinase